VPPVLAALPLVRRIPITFATVVDPTRFDVSGARLFNQCAPRLRTGEPHRVDGVMSRDNLRQRIALAGHDADYAGRNIAGVEDLIQIGRFFCSGLTLFERLLKLRDHPECKKCHAEQRLRSGYDAHPADGLERVIATLHAPNPVAGREPLEADIYG
jgi:hypothetical protein